MSATSDLTNSIILAVQREYPKARLWRLNSGAFYNPQGRLIRVGPPGLPDIDGYLPVNGYAVRLGIEVKRGRDRIRPEQQAWGDALKNAGGIYVVARSVAQALEELAALAK